MAANCSWESVHTPITLESSPPPELLVKLLRLHGCPVLYKTLSWVWCAWITCVIVLLLSFNMFWRSGLFGNGLAQGDHLLPGSMAAVVSAAGNIAAWLASVHFVGRGHLCSSYSQRGRTRKLSRRFMVVAIIAVCLWICLDIIAVLDRVDAVDYFGSHFFGLVPGGIMYATLDLLFGFNLHLLSIWILLCICSNLQEEVWTLEEFMRSGEESGPEKIQTCARRYMLLFDFVPQVGRAWSWWIALSTALYSATACLLLVRMFRTDISNKHGDNYSLIFVDAAMVGTQIFHFVAQLVPIAEFNATARTLPSHASMHLREFAGVLELVEMMKLNPIVIRILGFEVNLKAVSAAAGSLSFAGITALAKRWSMWSLITR